MLDAESEQMFKLNFTKSNSSPCADLLRCIPGMGYIMPPEFVGLERKQDPIAQDMVIPEAPENISEPDEAYS